MIEVQNLCCNFNNHTIIKNINISFKRSGLICIIGESGCGKTTFLNCLSGLVNYNGSIKIDGCEINSLNDDEASCFRLRNFGFVFQDFKLFEYLKVKDNISLPIETILNLNPEQVTRRVNDLLEIVGLNGYQDSLVSNLSGGEKQRVAIARSLITSPKVILADEPTGSLDSANSIEIMKILKSISKSKLVICVTHDNELAKDFCDAILHMEEGKIVNEEVFDKRFNNAPFLPISKVENKNKKISLPLEFIIKQFLQNISARKIRSLVGFSFTSIALLGIGLSVSFSKAISSNIKRSYSQLVETSEIYMEKNNEDAPNFRSLSLEDALEVKNEFPDEINGVGIIYKANFEEYFKDKDSLSCVFDSTSFQLEGFSSRNINEYVWLEDVEEQIYPRNYSLNDSFDVILGLNIQQIRSICYALKIDMNINSLSNYLTNNSIKIVLEFANAEWDYWDEQTLLMKGFCLTNNPFMCSNNSLWNQVMFEERMRFPTNETYLYNDYPWILDKLTYIKTDYIDEFLCKLHSNEQYMNILYDIGDKRYFPVSRLTYNLDDIDSYILYYGNDTYVTSKELKYIEESSANISNGILYSYGGYVSYPNSLLNGFSNRTYFCFNYELLLETMELNSHITFEENEREVLPTHILESDYSKTFENPVKFCSKYDDFISGGTPIDYSEIAISKGLYDQLKDSNGSNDFLYICTVINEVNNDYKIDVREYRINKLRISGITNNAKPRIYHTSFWPIDFYAIKVGISIFQLLPNIISFSLNDNSFKEATIDCLKRAFPQFSIINPLGDIYESVDSLCKTMSCVVFSIAIISLFISIILLSTVNYLNLLDMRKDIALLRCIGITKADCSRFVYWFSFLLCVISLMMASVELISVSVALSYVLAKQLSIDFVLTVEPVAFLIMFVIALFLSFFLGSIFSKKVTKINPLDCLRS